MQSYYHKYFEGYEEEIQNGNKKGTRTVRKYVGIYYRQGVTKLKQFMIRIFYLAIFIGTLALFMDGSMQSVEGNAATYSIP